MVFSGAVSIYVEYEIAERGAEGAHARLLLLRERERAAAMSQSTAKETNGGAAQRRSSSANLAEAGVGYGVGAAVGRAEARRASSEMHRGAGGTEVRSSEEDKEREQVSGCEAIHPACNPF